MRQSEVEVPKPELEPLKKAEAVRLFHLVPRVLTWALPLEWVVASE